MQVSVEIPVELEAIAIARDVVSRIAGEAETSAERVEEARLLTSEVVSRAIRRAEPDAGGSIIRLAVEVSSDRLRVEVTDPRPGLDPSTPKEPVIDEGGWGLLFVAELSDRWGAEPDSVWFELAL